jgi:phytoene/squalene synthetase
MDKEKGPKLNDDECVSQLELKEMMRAMTEDFKKYQDSTATSYEQLDRRVAELVTRMDVLEARPPHQLQPQLLVQYCSLLWTIAATRCLCTAATTPRT